MIKCLECGVEVNRIQWTHLKYKCTGKLNNCKEYSQKYPGARTIDEDLAKRTAVTEINLIAKYGGVEGKLRWEIYCKKQSDTNTFSYKQQKYGWTQEKFREFNKSRSVTIENCVQKHGEYKGLEIWKQYCERQSYTNSKEYFIKKYGNDDGLAKFLKCNYAKGSSARPVDVAKKLNISLEEATELVIIQKSKFFYSSELEKEFVRLVEDKIGQLEHSSLTTPFGKWSNELNSYVVYDIKHNDCIIEFNGDYWHCNPKLYQANDFGPRRILAKDIWERDRKKLQTALNYGYRVLTVWESDFKKNKEILIEEVIEWIQATPR
jgi:hypothetical protein